MHLIKLNDAKKHYCSKCFNLVIERKDLVLVEGKNGEGKSTLIELVLGFKHPDEGYVEKINMKVGYLPEVIMLPDLVQVSKYLETLAKVRHVSIDEGLLHLFDIPLFKSIHELSKGNKQKLAILSVFIGKPDLVVLDEPFSGLDEKSILDLVQYIKLKQASGLSFLIASHYPEYFENMYTKRLLL